jgi:F-type H+-transporting ATPase subunit b
MRRLLAALALAAGLAPDLALAAAEGGGGFISLDRSLLIQAVNFLLLLFLLWRFLYRPLVGKLEERSQAIRKSLAEAETAQAEAVRQREEHKKQLQAAYAEAQAIREQALKEAGEAQRKLLAGAQAQADRMVRGARAEIEQDVLKAREELRREVADLALAAAERLVKKSLSDQDHRRIVAEALAEIERGR